MTPPLCIECTRRPVKRCFGKRTTKLLGRRNVGGKGWNWFCSDVCWGHWRGKHDPHLRENVSAAARANARRRQQRVLHRIVDDVKPYVGEDGFVRMPVKDLVEKYYRAIQRERAAWQTREHKRSVRILLKDEDAWRNSGSLQ